MKLFLAGIQREGDMPASPEMIAVKEFLESQIFAFAGVTGIDIGMRDEESLDPEDLAIRIFVQDASEISPEINGLIAQFPVPSIILQRRFEPIATLPDTEPHRPVIGGTSIQAARLANMVAAGTLGAIGQTTATPFPLTVGLSNHHVLAFDSNRSFGQEMIQPEPGVLGRWPNDVIGRLVNWAYPELVFSGLADAAICTIEIDSLAEILELGAITGRASESRGMLVRKRGRTTGLTFGIVTTDSTSASTRGTYMVRCERFPAVNNPFSNQPTVWRQLTNQFQIKADFPQTIFFSDKGDSGSAVLDSDNRAVGLLHGSAYVENDGSVGPATFAIATPIDVVEQQLGITLTATV
ncbi:hypothetical protein [Streptomyces flavidovirens]